MMLLALMVSMASFAQNILGTVVDENGEPVIGATVVEKSKKAQTPAMLEAYDVIADSLLENALYFFRDRIENAFLSRDYAGCQNGVRTKRGKNDSIFERLDSQFTFEQAMQQSVAVKGAGVNQNTVRQMLKNWRKQALVVVDEDGQYRKVS